MHNKMALKLAVSSDTLPPYCLHEPSRLPLVFAAPSQAPYPNISPPPRRPSSDTPHLPPWHQKQRLSSAPWTRCYGINRKVISYDWSSLQTLHAPYKRLPLINLLK
ncbi:hypothetical protein AK830_g7443 [Neonectria ditissima]|uniref:Uncharacterized protein n=1 Tax=Neonectria ditissima TaxID=78410 RepID=A0A0P7BFD2_9HYPO|nr:hypothetical protein AK830_g7443 [Neonectria ditissima]